MFFFAMVSSWLARVFASRQSIQSVIDDKEIYAQYVVSKYIWHIFVIVNKQELNIV